MTETHELPIEDRPAARDGKSVRADVLVRDQQGRILLIDPEGLPGDVVQANESPRSAAQRALREKLGLELSFTRLLVVDYVSRDDHLTLIFDGGTLNNPRPDFEFCDPSEAGQRLPEAGRPRLSAACEGLRFQVSRYLQDGEMLG